MSNGEHFWKSRCSIAGHLLNRTKRLGVQKEEHISIIRSRGGFTMKVLMINGSPHSNGNTFTALQEMEKIFKERESQPK